MCCVTQAFVAYMSGRELWNNDHFRQGWGAEHANVLHHFALLSNSKGDGRGATSP